MLSGSQDVHPPPPQDLGTVGLRGHDLQELFGDGYAGVSAGAPVDHERDKVCPPDPDGVCHPSTTYRVFEPARDFVGSSGAVPDCNRDGGYGRWRDEGGQPPTMPLPWNEGSGNSKASLLARQVAASVGRLVDGEVHPRSHTPEEN